MPYFRYKAENKRNETVEGVVQAAAQSVAAGILRDQGLTIVSLQEEHPNILRYSLKIFNRVKTKDLVIFSRQLSVTISANIPLVQGLRILIAQTTNPTFKMMISEVADDVEGGAKLSAALARHHAVFSKFFVSLIKSGEASGKLDEILLYLANQQEKDYDLTSKIRGAMIYPAFILVGLVVVGTLMMVMVVPQLTGILRESGVELPLSTKVLIGTSGFLARFWWLLLLVIIGAGVAFYLVINKTTRGRYYWDTVKLRLPIFGSLSQKLLLVRFTRSLHTLLSGGVSLSRSLEVVSEVTNNVLYQKLINETRRAVESGHSIASEFTKSKEVPAMVSQMMQLGERTGRLDEILDKLANFYTREADNMISNLVTLIEPVVMVTIGIGVGLLVSAIILPIYNLATGL
ncbi:MAG: hypothetical protein A3J59_00915 [Candidatus Buchananbacteria bacterium RIFCSPHIGHO2_02_FULL_56_16]|uniref:Type II secretion system protein GspF domain-containing protein n=1 Tax=Candidatus Buchananbacteria bacterium RIFCSPHIGHO2_02_FULL_56_16 TaxID=1797542 RepID=A0A1G1YC85_9BACT|nr:MAG: hypothetical protein A3J59_00915 [Candidatus Buchananbacteria bacterium RIFCSPHIGHO2_02_FULL_56_16]